VAGARFLVQPVRSEATGLAALDAPAAGVPVVASAVGARPRSWAGRGCWWSPATRAAGDRDPAAWADDELHGSLVAAAAEQAEGARTWADVARETRAVWAQIARAAPLL
jgi:glycosyltransferase involved in cell wall biosynthesis